MANFELDDFRKEEDKIRTIQALWRGAYVRQQMQNVKDEYKALFTKLENKSTVLVQWSSKLCRPRFLSAGDQLRPSKPKMDKYQFNPIAQIQDKQIQTGDKPNNYADVTSLKNAVNQTLEHEVKNKEVNTVKIPLPPEMKELSPEMKDSTEVTTRLDQQRSSLTEKISVDLATAEEQRHNLALELLWLQQAIISRKQYLRHKTKIMQQGS